MRHQPTLALAALLFACQAQAYDSIKLLDPVPVPDAQRAAAAAASATRLFVLDEKGARLLIYDLADGKKLASAGGKGRGATQLDSPRGLALGPDGKVFVADTGNSRVMIFDEDGKALGSFGQRGGEPGQLREPESVAVGADGRVYVADTGNNRVQVFTDQGILLFSLGSSGKEVGQFKSPTKVAVDRADHVFVLDSGNDRVQEFDAAAKPARQLELAGRDFAVDDYGYLYFLDPKSGKVVEENAKAAVQGKFGTPGSGPGQFKKPEGVAVGAGGEVIVVDTGNKRVVRAELSNNEQTKILVSGPTGALAFAADVIAAAGDDLLAWLPKQGRLVLVGADGKEKARVAAKDAGKGPAATRGTRGFAYSSKQGLYLSDSPDNRLQHFDADWKWTANIAESTGLFDSKKKEGRVKDPRGVAINEKGTVYVADAGNRRVDAFSPEGVFLFGIGPSVGSLELQEPAAVAWDPGRFLYTLDRGLKKIVKTEPSGAYLASWGEPGTGAGQLQDPVALAYDGVQFLYVLDAGNKRVSVFSNDGRWMTDLFSGETLKEPAGLAVQGSRLFISDKGAGKILSFELHFRLAPPAGLKVAAKDGAVHLSWSAVKNAWLDGYEVLRSSDQAGPFAALAASAKTSFADTTAAALQRYWYKVASRSKTGDAGVPGAAEDLTVPESVNRPPVEISTVVLGNIFSANYKWYLKNPVGTATITNNVNAPFENVKLSFRLKDFMDFGYDTELKKVEPRQVVQVPLIATLNNKILEVSEDTPVQAEFTLTFFQEGQERKVTLTKPLRVYSRNAITWDDPRRIATFITPKDPPVLEFARAAGRAPRPAKAEHLNSSLVTLLQVWDALSEAGVGFFTNPGNPYEKISEDPAFPVDYTQFPRETLKRKSGQCDDLTTLLISMLDASKVKSAVVDYPGHMALLVDTEASDLADAGLPQDKLVKRDGTWWIPVEATLLGKPLPDAIAKAAQAFKAEQAKGKVKVIDPADAWALYEPATLPAGDAGTEAPKGAALEKRLSSEAETLAAEREAGLRAFYEAALRDNPGDADTLVSLGLLDHEGGKDDAAAERFGQALAKDPKNSAALTDLGNLAYLKGDFTAAQKQYRAAVDADAEDPDLWMNLARAEVKLKAKDQASEAGKKAAALDARLSPVVESLLKGL
jgi:DNA-binding beta-propeller fold protein YncE